MKKSPLYTFTGDSGTTSLVGGQRVPKDDIRIESYGTIDELNSHIGLLAAMLNEENSQKNTLLFIQNKLFNVGAYLATDNGDNLAPCFGLDESAIKKIEAEIDRLDEILPPLHAFLLPGGNPQAAQAHVCRTVCRRAERNIISLAKIAKIHPDVNRFINRLSDYFFVLARFNNFIAKNNEIFWDKHC